MQSPPSIATKSFSDAASAVARLEDGASSASLPPMSSYERKIVHDLVAERGLTSASEGEGRDRHTVITRA